MTDSFYTEFESSFRGARALITERLQVYDDFLQPLVTALPQAEVVDLGCGRGEWIEKMQSMGFSPHGVDLDEGMLESCRERGFRVHRGDALDYLATLADQSQAIVSAFHLVEHLQFEQLQVLITEALRVLLPAGLLIMETPNPENLIVATRNFYLDPTHQKPLPPELLSFLPRLHGFQRIKLVRLQESAQLRTNFAPTLAEVISGASPDYAVIAQKSAPAEILSMWNIAFAKDFGLSLQTLLDRYDHHISLQLKTLRANVQMLQDQMIQAVAMSERAEMKGQWAAIAVQEAKSQMHSNFLVQLNAVQEAKSQMHLDFLDQLNTVYMSRSWRITKPLRWLNFQKKLLADHGLAMRLRALFKRLSSLFCDQKAYVPSHVKGRIDASPRLSPRGLEIRDDLKKALADQGE
jgi:O-antigen chain-terminating methyltransferase